MALFPFMNCAGNRPFRFAIALLLPLAGGCDSAEEKAARYQSRAMENLARGEFDKAALDFRNVLRLEPNDAQALLGLGQVEEHRRNFDAAAKIYLSLAGRDTQNLESRVRLARLLLASGQFEAAERYAGQAYRLAPADPRVLAGKAGVALGRGEREEAVRLARAALQGAPGDATALMVLASDRAAASDFAGALDLLDRGKAEGGADLNLQLLKLKILQAMGDREKVEELFGDLSRQFPQSPVLRDHLVKWRLDNGRYADAEQAARDHARANGGDVAAQVKLVKVIARTRGTKAAIAEVKGIIAAAQDEERIAELGSAQAMLEFEAGEPEAALATLNDLIASLKDDAVRAGAQVQLARMLNDMKRWEAALEPAGAALESDPRNAVALEARAVSRMALGRNGEAVEDLVAGLVEKPGSASLTLLLAEAYERTSSAVLAEEQYSKALALTSHAPQGAMKLARFYLRYGRTGDAITLLEELRSRRTADREALALLGQLKLDAGDWQGAQELAADLRRVDGPAGETADFILAGALAGMNRHAEGVEMLRARLSRAADPQAAATELVLGYLRAGRFREAETLARDRLAQNGASPHWQVVLGMVLMAEGRAGEAEAAFTAAAGEGASPQGSSALARFYLRTGDATKAETAVRAGLGKNPQDGALALLLAEILEAQGRLDEAIAEYEKLMRTDPASAVVANNLASLLSERTDDPEALDRAFELAIRFHNSDAPQFLDTLGWLQHLRGNHNAALPKLRRAAEKLPESGAVQFHFAMALKEAGQADLAAERLRKAIGLAPAGARYVATAQAALDGLGSAGFGD